MSKIVCRLCGEGCHAIALHLRDAHGEGSQSPCTIDDYKAKYPDAPLLSEMAQQRIAAKQKPGAEAQDSTRVTGENAFEPMDKVFGLGGIKDAKTKSGKDIPISVCQQTGYEELIPDIDKGYIFNVDALKSVLLGYEKNIPVFVYGHSGTGKSTLHEQICARTRRRMVRLQHARDTEQSHIIGQWVVRKHKDEASGRIVAETVFELGPLPLAMIHGWVYQADEYDRSYPSVTSVYNAVLEGKPLYIAEADAAHRLIRPHPDFRFVATGNSNGSGDETGLYQATVVQDAATFERFGIVYKMDYMPRAQEVALVRSQTAVIEEDANKIIDFCTRVREQYPQTISLTIGPRVAINIARIGVMRGDFKKGVELAFANRLPASEREAAMQAAQRTFG